MTATGGVVVPNGVVVIAAAAVVVVASGAARRLTRPECRRPVAAEPSPDASVPSRGQAMMAVQHHRRMATTAGVVAAALGALTVGPFIIVVAGTVWLMHRLRPLRLARRRRATIERELPAAIDLLVLSVRAGLTPRQAVAELSTNVHGVVGEAFGEVLRRTQRGQPFADALGALGDLLGPQAGTLADVIATSDRHGLALGPTLDHLALEAAAARQRLAEADARRLPVKLSFPLVLCTLPSFVLLAIVPAMIAALSSLGGPAW